MTQIPLHHAHGLCEGFDIGTLDRRIIKIVEVVENRNFPFLG